jgi:hypothetical protein
MPAQLVIIYYFGVPGTFYIQVIAPIPFKKDVATIIINNRGFWTTASMR